MISVIIPTYNRKEYLKKALESIINQKDSCYEIIVIDDASTDGTAEYLNSFNNPNIKYYRNDKSLFAHGSRKRGLKYATGDKIIFMDDDDFYIDDYFFSVAENVLDSNDSVSIVIGSTQRYINNTLLDSVDLGGNGYIDGKKYLNEFQKKYKKPLSTLSAVFRRNSLEEIGISSFRMVNDTCIYLMGIIQGNVYLYNKPVAAYRVHNNNISRSKFKLSFLYDCLEAKNELFFIAKNKNLLFDPNKWVEYHQFKSISYFIVSSNRDTLICLFILWWIIFYYKGNKMSLISLLLKYR